MLHPALGHALFRLSPTLCRYLPKARPPFGSLCQRYRRYQPIECRPKKEHPQKRAQEIPPPPASNFGRNRVPAHRSAWRRPPFSGHQRPLRVWLHRADHQQTFQTMGHDFQQRQHHRLGRAGSPPPPRRDDRRGRYRALTLWNYIISIAPWLSWVSRSKTRPALGFWRRRAAPKIGSRRSCLSHGGIYSARLIWSSSTPRPSRSKARTARKLDVTARAKIIGRALGG